jgi:holo-[acyl-carrier protein] synthase
MVLSCGVDLVHISQMKRAVQRWGDRFLHRVFTPGERAYGAERPRPYEFYAARFAAKEAVIKALGQWRRGTPCPLRDIEILPDAHGRPIVSLSGRARQIQRRSRATHICLSLSHTGDYAVASVVVSGA